MPSKAGRCWIYVAFYARDAGVERLMKSSEYFGDEDTMREGNPQLVLERGEQTALPRPVSRHERPTSRWRYPNGSLRLINPSAGHRTRVVPDMRRLHREPGPETDRAIQLMKSFIAEQLKDR